ncbi:DUF4395 domain-containing protein [Natronobacterium texcoconense]|uniref:DUF4395 domain-containing protein n=1 Tax=Natronobacterium texcoconense TaxID=1095778 RepID=A0A1H1IVV9_NATTX|nr:DUF4395 domain-containing protein [Natronobacterium texcoconense]SDR41824.1 protein of unknown function [Natronobacterium texcoconense]
MNVNQGSGSSSRARSNNELTDPRAARFGQAITATLLLAGVALTESAFVYVVALILGLAVVSGWRLDAYRLLWQHVVVRVVGRPDELEAAAPHRFAKVLGAVGSGAATLFLLLGSPTAGFALAALVGLLAALSATTGFCLGCRMYRQVSFLQSRDVL